MVIDNDYSVRKPHKRLARDVSRFLRVFDLPRQPQFKDVIMDACVEMYRPLPMELQVIEKAVRKWCGIAC